MIRIPRRLLIAVLLGIGAAGLAGLTWSGAVAGLLAPRAVAGAADLAAQRAATERAVQRAYVAAADQLRKTRALRLPISEAQAAEIERRTLADLATLRHSALVSLEQVLRPGAADADSVATATERRLDAAPPPDRSANAPVLLAPSLFAIVQRMDELAAQLADRGTREMTAAPSGSPRPTASP